MFETEYVTDNDMGISNVEKCSYTQIKISQGEIEKMDYCNIGNCIEKLDKTGVTKNKLSLCLEGYKDFDSLLYRNPYIREWMRGLIYLYPYVFYLIDPSFGINPTIIAACIGDVMEITEKPSEIVNDYIITGYELVNYYNSQLKVKIPFDISNKIIEGIIDYGASVGGDPDNILSVILSIPGLNGG